MHSLIISHNQTPVDEHPILHDQVSIGRNIDNDIHIDDSTISNHHARIFIESSESYIEDMGSTNGTYVNGHRIKRHHLKPGDTIMIGQHRLELKSLQNQLESEDQEPTLQMSSNTIEQQLQSMPQTARLNKPAPDSDKAISWVAQDEDGIWWGFEKEPIADIKGWSSFQDTMTLKLKKETPNPDWKKTLHKL
ncbi:MAG: FHA domain-containing protein [Gammaproteobacteria bacterium]|nr:FHA domain-containing protein [Gammaproteobacteria bacterium]MDH5776821.1 FHA domain-containing protein [Gammaproteobacteria bacterium]